MSSPLLHAIANARDCASTTTDIDTLVAATTDPATDDAQLAAWLMAVRLGGLDDNLAARLCINMADSGTRLQWPDDGPPVVDKHSTGGVGDKVSLVLAPLMAAAGHRVPMLSGRSLGLTGGTLDKLEAIAGFNVNLSPEQAQRILADVGCFIAAATSTLAPADARLYRLRDVTATIDSVPLISASILSKKMAAGVSTLLLDVKYGNGAFMGTLDDADKLAKAMVTTGTAAGMDVRAALTPMNQPLGRSVGNAAEVHESIDVLSGKAGPLRDLVVDFAVALSAMAGTNIDTATFDRLLANGDALEVFTRMCAAQGAEMPLKVAEPGHVSDVIAPRGGRGKFDAHGVAVAAAALGATRVTPGGPVDSTASINLIVDDGDNVQPYDSIAVVEANDPEAVERAAKLLADAWHPAEQEWEFPQPVTRWVGR